MRKIVLLLAILIAGGGLFLMGLWYLGIPDQYVADKIRQLNVRPLVVDMSGFRKGLLFTFSADSLVMRNESDEIWRITDIRGNINPLRFFFARAVLKIRGSSYGGTLAGTLRFKKGNADARLSLEGVEISRIPALEAVGLKATGVLSGDLVYDGTAGRIEAIINNAVLSGIATDAMFIPLKYFHTVRGAAEMSPPSLFDIKSFTLEGRAIYARVKGQIRGRSADLGIEIMPEATFEDDSLFLLLDRYKVSEGYYFIPVRSAF